jgi:signal transduction histidine kinase
MPAHTPSQEPHRSIATARRALRHAWERYLDVRSDDVVRQTINRGFLQVVALFALIALPAAAISLLIGDSPFVALGYAAYLPFAALIAWLARRGGSGGALLLALLVAVLVAVGFRPETYVDPVIVHVAFVVPAVIAALFVRPAAGFAAVLIQLLLFVVVLSARGVEPSATARFVVIAAVDLLGIMVPIYIVARLYRGTVQRLSQTRAGLDALVSARTADLRRVMALREHDVTAVVHDIHNQMQLVRSAVDELLLDAADAGVSRDTLAQAERRAGMAVRSAVSLVDDLRTAVLLDNAVLRVRRRPVDLASLVLRTVDQHSAQIAQAGCRLTLDVGEQLPPVWVDAGKLERVLANLLGNAIKYTRQVGQGRGEIRIALGPEGSGVRLTVSDNGRGMEAEALARLGQPFTRLASARGTEGMGIGVYISRGIVELHGGRLSYDSAGPGKGTTATVWLPTRSRSSPDLPGQAEDEEIAA